MTPQQVSLFDAGPADQAHRTNGAETSRVAAVTVNRNRREAEVLDALLGLAAPVTSHDIEAHLARCGLHRPSNTVARRLTSLERQGRVRRCGVKQGPYGQPCTLWRLT